MKKRFLLFSLVLFSLIQTIGAQPHMLQVRIQNMPYNTVAAGCMRGDRFILSDSIITSNIINQGRPFKMITWNFPDNAQPGIYRIVFGYTTYARVMDEAPQQLDFIYNGEDIRLETDFRAPADSLKIISSEENKAWFSFRNKDREYRQEIKELELEVDYYQEKVNVADEVIEREERGNLELKAANIANSFNLLQMERESFIIRASEESSDMLVSRIIKTFREPFRDGYLSSSERNVSWQKNYFRFVDFSDSTIIYAPVVTDKIFDFLVSFNRREYNQAQREEAYIRAVDVVMEAVEKSSGKEGVAYCFVLHYLSDGFKRLNMGKVLSWMQSRYSLADFPAGDKKTIQRTPEAQ